MPSILDVSDTFDPHDNVFKVVLECVVHEPMTPRLREKNQNEESEQNFKNVTHINLSEIPDSIGFHYSRFMSIFRHKDRGNDLRKEYKSEISYIFNAHYISLQE